jgi:hypothetical protein
MSFRGTLATDEGIRELDRVMAAVRTLDSDFEGNFLELSSFFARHLRTGLLPVLPSTVFPSAVQRQVYSFINVRWDQFTSFASSVAIPDSLCDSAASLFLADPAHALAPLMISLFLTNRLTDPAVLGCPEFQLALYAALTPAVADQRAAALSVLKQPFPDSIVSAEFTALFLRFTAQDLLDSELEDLLGHFDSVLSRVDDPLVTYDFLYKSLARGAILALPFLVSVSVARAVDVSEVYEFTFRALTVASLAHSSRVQFLPTLERILCSSKLPSAVTTAFAVKLSRFLPLIPPDAQLDALGLLQALVRAHGAVAGLLSVFDSEVANVDGAVEDCRPQTLWEVKAMQHSPVPAIADTARKLGDSLLPPELASFNLRAAVEACRAPPVGSAAPGNWVEALDRAAWTFRRGTGRG